jgi:hypothetical protein
MKAYKHRRRIFMGHLNFDAPLYQAFYVPMVEAFSIELAGAHFGPHPGPGTWAEFLARSLL